MAVNFGATPVSYNGNQVIIVCSRPESQKLKGYTSENSSVVKWLCVTQLLLGITCFISQVVATALFEFVETQRTASGFPGYSFYRFNDADHGGTGIWVGLVIIIAASIGIAGCKQNRASLVVTHLVFNVFLLLAAISLITASGISVSKLRRCMSSGYYYGYYDSGDWNEVTFLGETLTRYSEFYCRHSLFKAWLAFSIIQVIASSVAFIISLTLLVYNSLAVCGRCCSCCYGNYAVWTRSTSLPDPLIIEMSVTANKNKG